MVPVIRTLCILFAAIATALQHTLRQRLSLRLPLQPAPVPVRRMTFPSRASFDTSLPRSSSRSLYRE
jgi:hypothetical protein